MKKFNLFALALFYLIGLSTAVQAHYDPDYLGAITVQYTEIEEEEKDCGYAKWKILWKLSAGNHRGGIIVQNVTMEGKVYDCDNKLLQDHMGTYSKQYGEGWSILPGWVTTSYYDQFSTRERGDCTKGWAKIRGNAEFRENGVDGRYNWPPGWTKGGVTNAGHLMSGETITLSGGSQQRQIYVTWYCCGKNDKKSSMRISR